jgi:polyisoprenoid-binding protein YceI
MNGDERSNKVVSRISSINGDIGLVIMQVFYTRLVLFDLDQVLSCVRSNSYQLSGAGFASFKESNRLMKTNTKNMETTTKKMTTATEKMVTTQTGWVLDRVHSDLTFRIRHMMITNVKGEFGRFDASLVSQGTDFSTAGVDVTIDATSITTGDDQRDGHLKSADFFDVQNFPKLSFKSISFIKVDDDEYKLMGILDIKDVSYEITLDVVFGGISKDPWGTEKLGFSVEGKISRKDFGLTWNAALETGGVLVGDEVKISAEVQFVRQQE